MYVFLYKEEATKNKNNHKTVCYVIYCFGMRGSLSASAMSHSSRWTVFSCNFCWTISVKHFKLMHFTFINLHFTWNWRNTNRFLYARVIFALLKPCPFFFEAHWKQLFVYWGFWYEFSMHYAYQRLFVGLLHLHLWPKYFNWRN